MNIEVLGPDASAMYLGRALSLTETHDVELDHRLQKAWAKFGTFKQELTDKKIQLHLRMNLFHSVVTPTALYGCGCWVMTGERDARLRSTQLKMLRAILGRPRLVKTAGDLETWVEWVQRTTHEARTVMTRLNIPMWTDEQHSRLQRWHDRVGQMSRERWARRVLDWLPDGFRPKGRPRARSADQCNRCR